MATNDDLPPAIEVRDLVKRFGDSEAVAGLSFTVRRGEILGVLGPNGAGKTTTINVLSTLLPPDGGTVRVAGHDVVADGHHVRRAISMTGQFAAVDDQLSGRENLLLFGRLRGLSRGDAGARADELLETFGLADAGAKRVASYSGGMRRRLDIACSLTIEPEILFLDEPTTGLDPRSRNDLWAVVRRLRADGLTIVLTTQYLEEADVLADRIIVVDHGRSVAEGTPAELKRAIGGATCVVSLADAAAVDDAAEAVRHLGETTIDLEQVRLTITSDDAVETLTAALSVLRVHSIAVHEAGVRQPTLDEVFLALTAVGDR
jgi:ABC-2 type transport system ATP-binding protein